MKNLSLRRIVVAGVMSAIAIFFGVTGLGYIPWFGGVSITIMVVPVVIAAVMEGPVIGLIVGLIFGVTSLIQAAVAPKSPLDPLFVYPWLSILPRLLIGPAAWLERGPDLGRSIDRRPWDRALRVRVRRAAARARSL